MGTSEELQGGGTTAWLDHWQHRKHKEGHWPECSGTKYADVVVIDIHRFQAETLRTRYLHVLCRCGGIDERADLQEEQLILIGQRGPVEVNEAEYGLYQAMAAVESTSGNSFSVENLTAQGREVAKVLERKGLARGLTQPEMLFPQTDIGRRQN